MPGFQGCPLAVRRKGDWGKPERFESSGGFPQKEKEE